MNAEILYPPARPATYADRASVFLAGSVEMGAAEDWQTRLIDQLQDLPISIYNPRRKDWNSTWAQTKENGPFREQVEWELDHLECADLIALYFDPATKSPISLLELGLFAERGKVIVCCPPGFWRKGNVDIVAERYGIPVYEGFDSFAAEVVARMGGLS